MKKPFVFFLVIVIMLVLGGCVMPASPAITPSAESSAYPAPDGLTPGQPAGGETTPGQEPGAPAVTATPLSVPESAPAQPPAGEVVQPDAKLPTSTPLQPEPPTSTPIPPIDDGPTSTPLAQAPAGPSATPTFAVEQLDALAVLGDPTFEDPMNLNSKTNWARPETGVLPDSQDFAIEIKDNKFYAIGKRIGWATWWFSWPSLKDFYLEMEVNSSTCSGKDAYGLILRGPQHLAGVSYGYVVALSCDGSYQVFRLDGVDPWRAVTLVDWKASSQIRSGSNQLNVLGVRMEGEQITVFINGKSVVEFEDDEYSEGRYGLYVRADSTSYYTFQPLNIAYWDLAKVTPTPKP